MILSMKYFLAILVSLVAVGARCETGSGSARDGVVLVYSGPGAGSAPASAEIAASMGFKIRYVTPADIKPALFKNAKVWMQPGGDAIEAAQALGAKGLKAIREFVKNGGGYVGFCAGAFLADKTVDNPETIAGLGIIPIGTYDYPLDNNHGHGDMTWIDWGGKRRHVFFNGGGSFYVNKEHPEVHVLASFAADGAPATIEVMFGKGHVVVSGAHPEASAAWKSKAGVIDQDGPDFDLAVDMVERSLKGTP